MRRLVLLLTGAAIVAAVTGCASRTRPRPSAWRTVITQPDKDRLRDWRTTWMLAVAQARADGAATRMDQAAPLFDPDAGLADPTLPDGDYACRTTKLGRQGSGRSAFVAYPAFTCRVSGGRLVKLDGSQRPAGTLWRLDPTRLIFLGSMALGDEARALDYGRDRDRDMVGIVERIGPGRWRMAVPRPRWESLLDIIELTPRVSPSSPGRADRG